MNHPEALLATIQAFPGSSVVQCRAGTREAVLALAARRSNGGRGEEPDESGGAAPSPVPRPPCPLSPLLSGQEALRWTTDDEALSLEARDSLEAGEALGAQDALPVAV